MVVVHCITRFNQGGTVTWLNNLLVNQERAYLVAGECSGDEREGIPHSNFDLIKISSMKRSINPVSDFVALIALVRIFRRIRPELLVTHTFKAGVLARVAAKISFLKRSTKVVHTYHGHLQYGYFSRFGSRVISWIEKCLEFITDGFIVNGLKVSRDLIRAGLLRKPYMVILPGVELLPAINSSSAQEVDHRVTVGWLGRLTNVKRPDRVISQAHRFPSVNFLVGGEGELESELRSVAPSNLEFLGWTPPGSFWSKADVGLLTSENEAAPFSLVEAASYGVPCVATDVGSVSDVILDGETGFLVVPTDDSISEKLGKLIEDEDLRRQMSINARNRAAQEFTLENFRNKHRDFFLRVMTS